MIYICAVRYLVEDFAVGALNRGRSIEQFLGSAGEPDNPGIRWVEIVPSRSGFKVILHTSRDVGGEHFADLVEFPPLEDSDQETFGQELATVSDPHDALSAAHQRAGAVLDRWVNQGIAGHEYLDYVRAGRPSSRPAAPPACGNASG